MLHPLEDRIHRARQIFEQDQLRLPISVDRLNTIDRCGEVAKATELYYYRIWQASNLGFESVTEKRLADELMGYDLLDFHNSNHVGEQTNYDRIYNHHLKKTDKRAWKRRCNYWSRLSRNGLLEWPPLGSKVEWQCRFIKLNDLKAEIPYGVMLRILEVVRLGIFNCFHVMEPIVRLSSPLPKPVFVATIWELPLSRNEAGRLVFDRAGHEIHFFLSEWCKE